MFLTSTSDNFNNFNGRVSVLGEFVKIEGNQVILRLSKGQISVTPKGIESYKTKYVLVTGTVENNILIEEHVQRIEEDFNFELFNRLAKQIVKYTEIF
jgi:hypothetical protein